MSSFEETLARMKGLYTYGKDLNENKDMSTHTLEYHAIGADGKSYGIIRECNKYYIKTAPKDKEMVAESYEYIGGFCNKKNYEYASYANALKNFEMKMASINEAYDGNVNISTLDPFKKEDFLAEGTERMKNEIARQRQIMYNASMIMNEEAEIGATEKDNVVKKQNPNQFEAPKKNGNTINDHTDAKVVEQDKVKGTGGHKPNIVGPFDQKVNEGACCGKCGKEPCECKNCNEEAGDIGDAPLMPNTENWGTEGIGKGRDPKQVGWEMEGQQKVNEENDEWDEGLPSSAGIGDPDTGHNNDPFNKSINESDEDFNSDEEETVDINIDDDSDEEDLSTDTDFDDGIEDEFSDENVTDDFGTEEFSDKEKFDDEGDEFSDEEEFDDESGEFSDEEEFDDEGDEFSDEEEFDDESDEFSDEEGFDDEGDEFSVEISDEDDEFSDDEDQIDTFDDEEDDEYYDDEIDECGMQYPNEINEGKRRRMNRIVESVVKSIMNEDELHVFGKHPGYRKKPMELPSTGEDRNQWGRDWNDDSVHSEEPFGKQIGNGDPFNQLVNAVTKDVMYQMKKGVPIEGINKKKVD